MFEDLDADAKPHRKCSSCFKEPAVSAKGGAWFQKYCRSCCKRRRDRSAHSKTQPKCLRCNNKAPHDNPVCRGCQDAEQRERDAFVRNAERTRVYLKHGVVLPL